MLKQYKKVIGCVLKYAPKESLWIVLIAITVGVIEGVCTQLNILVYREIGNFLNGEGNYAMILTFFTINIILSPHYYLYLPMDEFMKSVLLEKLQRNLLSKVFDCTYHRDMNQLEDPELYERVSKASDDTINQQYRKIIDAMIYIPLNVSCFLSVIVVLAAHSIWLALIALVGLIPTFIARILQGKGYFDLYNSQTKKRQYRTYLWDLLNSYSVNRDIKVWNHGAYLREQYNQVLDETLQEEWELEKKNFWRSLFLDSLQPLSIAIAIMLSVYFICIGEIEIAVFAALLQAMISVNETSSQTIDRFSQMLMAMPYINQFFQYVEETKKDKENSANVTAGFHKIEFQDVSFRYPASADNCIDHVSFVLHEKESIALVGENGAGKSTLVKLLLRIYQPQEGRILMDGVDINEIDEECFYSKISAVFQDFVKYKLSLRENIAISDLSKLQDTKRLKEHIAKYQFENIIEELPQGVDTVLGREFGEVELSGGQWQKVAIARGGLKECELIILDEPTASIDPVTESEIFHRFRQFTKNCCSVIISHRIGAARIANRILVLDHGKLVEDGSHKDLIAKNGIYQRLYHMQAQWYS